MAERICVPATPLIPTLAHFGIASKRLMFKRLCILSSRIQFYILTAPGGWHECVRAHAWAFRSGKTALMNQIGRC